MKPLDDFISVKSIVADTALALRPNAKNILDVACGGCFLAMDLMDKFPNADFTLLDNQEHMIRQAKKRTAGLTSGNISYMQEDMRTVKIPIKSYDVITCMTVLHFVDTIDLINMLKKFKRWLTRNGVLILEVLSVKKIRK